MELQTLKIMKLFGSTKKLKDKVPILEEFEVVLVQCNLVVNLYQQKTEILYILLQINLMLIC